MLAYQDRALRRLRDARIEVALLPRIFTPVEPSAPLSALPVLTKQMLMESFDSVVTRPGLRLVDVEDYLATLRGNELFQSRYFVSATAGTTGRRGIFLWNFPEAGCRLLQSGVRLAGSIAGLTHRVKTAVVSSTNPSHQPPAQSLHSQPLGPTLRIDSGMISTASSLGSTTGSRRC